MFLAPGTKLGPYVRPFNPASPEASGTGPGKIKISTNGGNFPEWGPNGKELLFRTPDVRWWSVDMPKPSDPKPLPGLPRGGGALMPDGSAS